MVGQKDTPRRLKQWSPDNDGSDDAPSEEQEWPDVGQMVSDNDERAGTAAEPN